MEGLMSGLTIVLIFLIFFIIILLFIYWVMSRNAKMKAEEAEKIANNTTTKVTTEYTRKSIFKFMQFDKIEDNMIVQDNGQRYLMVIECEGVNYDLMSQMEKSSVEAGFVQFLNTLRFPIQLYVQTRTINIEDSIGNYNKRIEEIKKELENKKIEYNKLIKSDNYNEKQEEILNRELIRIRNLYEYGQDVVNNIQKTSQNKNVLRKHYYVVVPYYAAEIGIDTLNEEEKKSLIFSELYTRAQTLINALFSCEMKSRILDSDELVDLLYVAYNREDSEIFGVDKAIKAGYSELYSTAPDVLDKRMKSIDAQIKENATELARDAIDDVRKDKERKIKKKEDNFDELVKQMAEVLIRENERYVGKEVTEKAIDKIKSKKSKEGGISDGEKPSKRTRKNATTK